MTKRAIIYTRVSTDEQAIRGYSLRDQYEKLKAYCIIHGIDEVAHYQDDHSAKSFERPAFKKLLEFLRKNKGKVDLLLFIKWDRFSRNATESYEMLGILKKLNVEAQAVEQPLNLDIPENKMMLAIFLASPEIENDRRSLNTISGMRRSIKEGRWCGKAPKGYDNKRDDNNKPIIVQNKDADIIQQIFELIQNGENSQESIRKAMLKKGFKCSKNQFSKLLRNPTYMGKNKLYKYKEEEECLISGIHKPIISEETFYKVQDILSGRGAKRNHAKLHGKRSELPLRGFLVCPRCGGRLTGSASKGHGGRYYYYHCTHGCKERVRATQANEKFVELLHDFQPKDEIKPLYDAILKDLLLECETGRKENLKSVESELKKVQERLEHLQDKLADDLIEVGDYTSIKKRYELQLKELNDKRKNMVFVSKEVYDQLLFSFSFLKDLPSFYSEASLDVQQRIIGSIFPESLSFSENKYRTSRINSVVELICNINKPFERNEKGQFSKKTELSYEVAGRGLEPLTFGL